MIALAALAAAGRGLQLVASGAAPAPALPPRAFTPLPVGSVKPGGWMRQQLEAQLHGIGGRWLGSGARVTDSKWINGSGGHLWNGAQAYPYWLNGAVALAAQLDDPGLTRAVHAQMDTVYSLAASPAADGWLGPLDTLAGWEGGKCGLRGQAKNGSCGIAWSAFRFLSAAIQYDEAFPQDGRTAPALHAFAAKLAKVLRAHPMQDDWAVNRWQEPLLAFEWLLEKHPGTAEQTRSVLDAIGLLRAQVAIGETFIVLTLSLHRYCNTY